MKIPLKKKDYTYTHKHRCVLISRQEISSEKVKPPTQPFHKQSHLFYQNKPGEYHELFQPEVPTPSMSISA